MSDCRKCEQLFELYEQTPKTNRDYWLMTNLFVMIHGSDICNDKKMSESKQLEKPHEKLIEKMKKLIFEVSHPSPLIFNEFTFKKEIRKLLQKEVR